MPPAADFLPPQEVPLHLNEHSATELQKMKDGGRKKEREEDWNIEIISDKKIQVK